MSFTEKQQQALDVKDRTLLLSAGAGSGKTFTLIERIIRTLTDPENPVDITELLIVTFTNAAVAEIKTRVEKALTKAVRENPKDGHLQKQLTLLSVANIMTVDGLCQEFLKKNAEELGLLPNYRIADTAEISLLASDVMENVLTGFYEGAFADRIGEEDFLSLVDTLVGVKGQAAGIGDVLLSLYAKTVNHERGVMVLSDTEQYYPDAKSPEETPFGAYQMKAMKDRANHYITAYAKILKTLDIQNKNECKWLAVLNSDMAFLQQLSACVTYAEARAVIDSFVMGKSPSVKTESATDGELTSRKKRRDFKDVFVDKYLKKTFLCTADEFMETYERTRQTAKSIFIVLSAFDAAFLAEKTRLGVCEYADLERYFYKSLWKNGERTATADMLCEQYRMIFVDEYQDISPLQHKIFEALSKEDNRFMVGDIKQSIYGFRSADPTIFAGMKKTFPICLPEHKDKASTIYMSENFRCDEGIVKTVNEIFGVLFHAIADSIGYVDDEAMIYKKETKAPFRKTKVTVVEKVKSNGEDENDPEQVIEENTHAVAAEAHAMAREILNLLGQPKDDGKPISFGDIVVLMRGAKRMQTIIDVFEDYSIPCRGQEKKEFFKNPSVLLALSLLNAIDNPYRDIYLCGALLSPLFGFTPDDLRLLRAEHPNDPLYVSLNRYVQNHADFHKGSDALRRLSEYRLWASDLKLPDLLFRLYHETGLLTLAVQNNGEDNLWLLYENARKFENSSYEGLGAFIRYVNRILDSDGTFDPPDSSVPEENAVRLLTIHASKGLEFPVVFVPECGKKLTDLDARDTVLYSDSVGLAPVLFDPGGTVCIETPMRAVLKDISSRKMLDEEMRIFYVALTRAAERLYLFANTSDTEEKWEEKLAAAKTEEDKDYAVLQANSFLEFTMLGAGPSVEFTYVSCEENQKESMDLAQDEPKEELKTQNLQEENEREDLKNILKQRFAYEYHDILTIGLPEKLSVSKLYPTVLDGTDDDFAIAQEPAREKSRQEPRFLSGQEKDLAAKRGIATHAFLQFCDFENLEKAGKEAELTRLTDNRFLSQEDAALVRLEEIEKFRSSDLAKRMRQAVKLHREMRFHVRLPAEDFTEDTEKKKALAGKKILVQGVMDCVMENADGSLTLVDYKTDRLPAYAVENHKAAAAILREKHEKQLRYYREAVKQIFGPYPLKTQIYSMMLGISVDI